MRKRNCKYRGVKLCSCNGMELIRYAFIVCFAALVASCKHTSPKKCLRTPAELSVVQNIATLKKAVPLTAKPQLCLK